MNIDTLIARAEALQVLNRFVQSIDGKDYVTMRSCLADEVEFDYFELGTALPRSANSLVKKVSEGHRSLDGLQHLTSNHIFNV
jgi:hypothetical protein